MRRFFTIGGLVLALSVLVAAPVLADGRPQSSVQVYVTSQGLVYDSIVLTGLPPHGRFQLLEMTGPTGLQTEFGPGDPGYLGGRWWVDVNGD